MLQRDYVLRLNGPRRCPRSSRVARVEWLLPGHGAQFHAASADAMRAQMVELILWMRTVA